MSHIENELWLEASRENFNEALSEGNLHLAKEIIADVMDVSPASGRELVQELRASSQEGTFIE